MSQVSGVCIKRIDRKVDEEKTLLLADAKVSILVPYIRFNNVELDLRSWKSNEEVIEMFLPILRQLGSAFTGSSLFINAKIDEQNPRCFSSNAKLFEFVEEQLLPMFNSPRQHTFRLDLGKHSSVYTFDAFFSSLFQHRLMDQISDLAIVSLNIDQPSMLPWQSWITILNWLAGVGNSKCYNMPGRERILRIYLAGTIQNWIVLIDFMKQVWCFLMSYF